MARGIEDRLRGGLVDVGPARLASGFWSIRSYENAHGPSPRPNPAAGPIQSLEQGAAAGRAGVGPASAARKTSAEARKACRRRKLRRPKPLAEQQGYRCWPPCSLVEVTISSGRSSMPRGCRVGDDAGEQIDDGWFPMRCAIGPGSPLLRHVPANVVVSPSRPPAAGMPLRKWHLIVLGKDPGSCPKITHIEP